jgi:hypothetical protein
VFTKKNKDYGTSWRVMRLSSIADQVFIKAQRLRTIENKGTQKVTDDAASEYTGIVNYCVLGLIQMELGDDAPLNINGKELGILYDKYIAQAKALMEEKNHDYGEAWRDMRISTYTDMMLMRLLRIRQIEDSNGTTLVSEGIDSNLKDMINYALFALIRLDEKQKQKA